MPVKACSEKGLNGWKWGDSGKCYTYPTGNTTASGKAKQKAFLQGAAMTGGKMTEDKTETIFIDTTEGNFWLTNI